MACLRLRIADRSVLKLIRLWLEAPVVEPPETKGGAPKVSRTQKGTPQGRSDLAVAGQSLPALVRHGVSPLREGQRTGPRRSWSAMPMTLSCWCAQPSPKLVDLIEAKLETWMGLEINREKTRVVELKQKGASLDFLGFTFRWERSRLGPGHYWNVTSLGRRASQRERVKLKELTSGRHSYWPIPMLIGELNQHYLEQPQVERLEDSRRCPWSKPSAGGPPHPRPLSF